jgi:hypothetical protein
MMVAASEVRRAVGTFTAGRNEKVNIYIAPARGEAGEKNVLRAERLVINRAHTKNEEEARREERKIAAPRGAQNNNL